MKSLKLFLLVILVSSFINIASPADAAPKGWLERFSCWVSDMQCRLSEGTDRIACKHAAACYAE